MRRRLLRHPDSPPSPVREIRVDAARLVDGRLSLVWMALGDIARLRLPAAAAPVRADGLWRATCFEAFVRPPGGEAYFELNFAPSRQWAAYRFDRYRSGMARAGVEPDVVRTMADSRQVSLVAAIGLGPLPELVPWESWRIGVAAVIEAEDGSSSHWALAHPAGAPDFHHRDCFAADLAPAATL